jgi:hypothetical protein
MFWASFFRWFFNSLFSRLLSVRPMLAAAEVRSEERRGEERGAFAFQREARAGSVRSSAAQLFFMRSRFCERNEKSIAKRNLVERNKTNEKQLFEY